MSAFSTFKSNINLKNLLAKGTPGFTPQTGASKSSGPKQEEQIKTEQGLDLTESTRSYMLLNFNLDINLLQEYKRTTNELRACTAVRNGLIEKRQELKHELFQSLDGDEDSEDGEPTMKRQRLV